MNLCSLNVHILHIVYTCIRIYDFSYVIWMTVVTKLNTANLHHIPIYQTLCPPNVLFIRHASIANWELYCFTVYVTEG